jgi:small subunit ribosomal protein S3
VFKGEVLEHDPTAHERRATEGNDGGQRSEREPRRERGDRERA